MPDGTPFSGPEELGAIVAKDPRFTDCAASKMLAYGLGRDVEIADASDLDIGTMKNLTDRWATRGPTLRNLMKEVVLTDAFRFRRGEPE